MRVEKIGAATLYLGDCRDFLVGIKADAVVTDPPYGIGADKGAAIGGTDASGRYLRRPKQYEGGWDGERPVSEIFDAILACSKDAIVWGGNFFSDLLPKGGRWLFWDKMNSMPTYSDGEMAWTSIAGCAVKKFTQCNNGMASLKDGERVHPTQKPVDLMKWCIGFLPNAKTILDPFAGSGTTGVAAVKMGRNFVGIEREQVYFDAMCRRIEQAQRQSDLFIKQPNEAAA